MATDATPRRLPAPVLPPWLEAMVPFERYRISIGEYRMHVMETGRRDGLPVLMMHGNPTWGFIYRRVATALEAGPLRLVMPDLIGLGFSDKPHRVGDHTLEHHGRWLGTLLDALGLERVVLVGQDWGGPIGLMALRQLSTRLAGLVLMNTGVFAPRADFRPTLFHRLSHMPGLSDFLFRVLGFPIGVMSLVQGDRRSIRGAVTRAYRYPLRRLADRIAPLALARMVPNAPDHPSVAGLAQCEVFVRGFRGPSALVWGERDPILGRECQRLAAVMPSASIRLTAAGHFLQEEVPEVIADAIREVAAAATTART
jgi:pimeloyl-ACP methyl ester carboxylesterase